MALENMVIVVEVFAGDQDIHRKEGTSKRNGKPYKMVRQKVYTQVPGERFPLGFTVMHFDEKDVLKPGKYVFDIRACLQVNDYGDLRLDNIRAEHFHPVAAPQQQAKAS